MKSEILPQPGNFPKNVGASRPREREKPFSLADPRQRSLDLVNALLASILHAESLSLSLDSSHAIRGLFNFPTMHTRAELICGLAFPFSPSLFSTVSAA